MHIWETLRLNRKCLINFNALKVTQCGEVDKLFLPGTQMSRWDLGKFSYIHIFMEISIDILFKFVINFNIH